MPQAKDSIDPGTTAFTRMPWLASAAAWEVVQWITAAWLARTTVILSIATDAAHPALSSVEPKPEALFTGTSIPPRAPVCRKTRKTCNASALF